MQQSFIFLTALVCSAAAITAQAQAPPTPEALAFFESEIRPVLVEHCYGCHTAEKHKGGLLLNSAAGWQAGGDTGPILDAGAPGNSRVLRALAHDGELKMPPSGKLPQEQIDAIAAWIAMGAPWPDEPAPAGPMAPASFDDRLAAAKTEHWSFKPVTRPEVPAVADPSLVNNPIDAFVEARLEGAALSMSPEADRRTLIRRATFDLTGLPPTEEEVTAFEQNPAPDAYAQLVESLLASPRYGERWGRYWLDVARYADTKGYVFQEERTYAFSHTYRDFVIRAFNEDLPYDQFIKYQLAADRMPLGDDNRPLAAMGFLTLGRRFINNINDITDDRIDVVSRGLLGLTVSCARCHDHKFDPISAADYYAMYGIFRSSEEPAELPLIETPDPADPDYQAYLAAVSEKEAELARVSQELHTALLTQTREHFADYLLAAYDARAMDEAGVKILAAERTLLWQLVLRWKAWLESKAAQPDPMLAPWAAFAALPDGEFAAKAPELLAQIRSGNAPSGPVNPAVQKAFAAQEVASMGDVAQAYRAVLAEAGHAWGELLSSQAQASSQTGANTLALPLALPDANLEAVRQWVQGAESPANIKEAEVYDLSDVPTQGRIREARNAIVRVKSTHPGRPDRAMVMEDAATPFAPYVFKRGKPENRGDDVPRRVPALLSDLAPAPFDEGSGRLQLAEAIANPGNPLTARVFVNRVWMHHFGEPLINTPSDFGLRSEPPTNPALLDYLASEFMAQGWSVKALHRLIMLSHAYRQASWSRPEGEAVDPENRMFWRQNRLRLDFEALRDAVLATSGDLDLKMGGPSVDITTEPFTTRRTVYSFIERQNLPAMFRTFDFAGPDAHSPQRLDTTVPQQALFMMNSAFLADQARRLAARSASLAAEGSAERVREVFALALQRDPTDEERSMAEAFLARESAAAPMVPAWQYGYGGWNAETQQIEGFTPLPFFDSGSWRGGPDMPDPAIGWVSLQMHGGHPGNPERAVVRRWTSPSQATVRIHGLVKHPSDQGDGITAYIAVAGRGVVWTQHVHNGAAPSEPDAFEVAPGDVVDFVVHCGANESFDSFSWAPLLDLFTTADAAVPFDSNDAARDFGGPPPPPLGAWEKLAQTLLMTNEFVFID